jgi:predicted ATPase
MSSGARFVRADLHVHTRPDGGTATASPQDYIRAAVEAGVSVMAITDHNSVDAAPGVMEAARDTDVLVLPGIEITTHGGHLLAIFAPEALETLQAFATRQNLRLEADPQDGNLRSSRSMLELVHEIGERGGLAIPAHVDAKDGIHEAMPNTALVQLLADPALAGLEFATHDAMQHWFVDSDGDSARQQAWRARMSVEELAGRGLARLMSSDAHRPEKVGGDRPSRTMTRLRLDEPTFDAVRNAILFNPKARCKAEVDLPAAYPRVLSATFEGGFLDGMEVEFSPNLNCFIGGRGAGKSTALLAIRAALGADMGGDDDPDDPDRMPDVTTIRFLDRAGNERTAIRRRGEEAAEENTGVPIELELADMGQGASGRLAREYAEDPGSLRTFLDAFVDLSPHTAKQAALLEQLEDNAGEVTRAGQGLSDISQAKRDVAQLQSTLKAAENSKVEQLAQYAAQLTAENQLLERLEELTGEMLDPGIAPVKVDLDVLASETGTNLSERPASDHLSGDHDVDQLVTALAARRDELRAHVQSQLASAGAALREELTAWKTQHGQWSERMQEIQRELDEQGLKVQAGEILRVSTRLNAARERVRQLEARKSAFDEAQNRRRVLLQELTTDRDLEHQRRRVTLRKVVEKVNEQAEGLRIHISVAQHGDDHEWCEWLTANLGFRHPRVERIAADVSPQQFATALERGASTLGNLKADGAAMLDEAQLQLAQKLRKYPVIFTLQTMRRDDRVHIDVSDPGAVDRRPFDHLSAGQQRSVLLSLMLSADRDDPLIIDQPEDHLDAQYIARSVVRQLEAAKERRQVIIATHSANLVVLGDAELVIPMVASGGHGHTAEPGAVDRLQTRELVCQLLEGGRGAFKRRGERYGFEVRPAVR